MTTQDEILASYPTLLLTLTIRNCQLCPSLQVSCRTVDCSPSGNTLEYSGYCEKAGMAFSESDPDWDKRLPDWCPWPMSNTGE